MPRTAKAAPGTAQAASVLPAASAGLLCRGTGESAKPLTLLALISGENQTGEQNADVAATTVPSQAPRESQMDPSIEPRMPPLVTPGG